MAFIDALGTIHFCKLHVQKVLPLSLEISPIAGLGTCRGAATSFGLQSLNAAEEQLKLSFFTFFCLPFVLLVRRNDRIASARLKVKIWELWELKVHKGKWTWPVNWALGFAVHSSHCNCIKNVSNVADLLLVPVKSNALFPWNNANTLCLHII